MNYFAHGVRFLDRPYFLAGTAVPDWLSVADRRVRMRVRRIEPLQADLEPGSPAAELAAGILQHLHDDHWFHSTRSFIEVSAAMTDLFRGLLPGDESLRSSFLGHITTELLLDAALIDARPAALEGYYTTLEAIDPRLVEAHVNRFARDATDRLAPLVPLFLQERFLADYVDHQRLLTRLNQVLRRVKLPPLPGAAVRILESGRDLVGRSLHALLPPEHFSDAVPGA